MAPVSRKRKAGSTAVEASKGASKVVTAPITTKADIPEDVLEISESSEELESDEEEDAELDSDEDAGMAGDDDDDDEQIRTITNEMSRLARPKSSGSDYTSGQDSVFSKEDGASDSEPEDIEGEEDVDEDDENKPNYRTTTDANGNIRYIYSEIEPGYDSDDSDFAEQANTIGDIPLSYYDAFPHIGYDINGKKIMRPAKGAALDALLDSIEVPEGWTGLTDPSTGKPLLLSHDELSLVQKVARGKLATEDGEYDPYEDMSVFFSKKVEIMPLSAAPEPKRRFVPSKHEAKRVMKIVRAIREGRIQVPKKEGEQEHEDDPWCFDAWSDEFTGPRLGRLAAPKLPPPTHDESVHPPAEYLPDEKEKKEWLAAEPEDREKEYLPTNYDALRQVPGYDRLVKERFDRSLDLYLAPRIRRKRHEFDPETLLPKLPRPEELRPFPTFCSSIFTGHNGRVKCVAIDPTGAYVASGGDDGTVRLWELSTGRQLIRIKLGEPVGALKWRPGTNTVILAAAAGNNLYFIVPEIPTLTPIIAEASQAVLDAGFGHAATKAAQAESNVGAAAKKLSSGVWSRPPTELQAKGVCVQVVLRSAIRTLTFHRRGEYLATVAPKGLSHAVAIHNLSQHRTQLPFRRLKGIPQSAVFHPNKPHFLIVTQRSVRVYDLAKQVLIKTLKPGCVWASTVDVHPSGDAVIVGSFDRRVLWHDLDNSIYPNHAMRFHRQAVRAVQFHPVLPLFLDASDDGTCQVFHSTLQPEQGGARIVPVKMLKGHKVVNHLGVLDADWHPRMPWMVSAGADGSIRLWT